MCTLLLLQAYQVCSQVDAEDGDGTKREGYGGQDEEQEGSHLGDVGRQRVGYGLLEVVKDQPTWRERGREGGREGEREGGREGGEGEHV